MQGVKEHGKKSHSCANKIVPKQTCDPPPLSLSLPVVVGTGHGGRGSKSGSIVATPSERYRWSPEVVGR